jgi:hypothetical protein
MGKGLLPLLGLSLFLTEAYNVADPVTVTYRQTAMTLL